MAHADEDNAIYWYEPEVRGIIPIDTYTPSKRLQKIFHDERFKVTANQAFEEVIHACAERKETWISDEIIDVYIELHRRGYGVSIEVWENGELGGGLYGIWIEKAFFGESMFHRRTDCSKVALMYLINMLRIRKVKLLDTQFITSHLKRFGAIEIPKDEYQVLLKKALGKAYIGGGLKSLHTFATG